MGNTPRIIPLAFVALSLLLLARCGLGALPCLSDRDCADGESCRGVPGRCEGAPSDAGSDGGEPRSDGGVDGGSGDGADGGGADGGGHTDGGEPGRCEDRYDCAFGESCSEGTCRVTTVTSCGRDGDCPRGEICNYSRNCEPGCVEPRDCADGLLCHPTHYECAPCSLANPCPKGLACTNGTCAEATPCDSHEACAELQDGLVCSQGVCGNCASHGDCSAEPYSSANPKKNLCGAEGRCVALPPVPCDEDECRALFGRRAFCHPEENRCAYPPCEEDADCPAGRCSVETGGCYIIDCFPLVPSCEELGKSFDAELCQCRAPPGEGTYGDACSSDEDCKSSEGWGCFSYFCAEACTEDFRGVVTGKRCEQEYCELMALCVYYVSE